MLRSLVIVGPLLVTLFAFRLLAGLPYGGYEIIDPFLGGILLPVLLWIAMFVVVVATPDHRGLEDRAGRSIVVLR